MPCSNADKARNPLKLPIPEPISAVNGAKFTILWGHLEDILLLNNFFPIVDTSLVAKIYSPTKLRDGEQTAILATFLRPVFQRAACSTFSDLTCMLNSH